MTLGKKIFIVCFACAALFLSVMAYWASTPISVTNERAPFVVRPGSLNSTIQQMSQQGIPINKLFFTLMVRFTGNGSKLKAGYYELRQGDSPWQLMNNLSQGKFVKESITIVEGWSFSQMRKTLASHNGLHHDTANLSDRELLDKLGIHHAGAEGLFFPDTYVFPKGTAESQIYKQAHDAMTKRLNEFWKNRDASLPYETPYHALIMASIVEKETGLSSDRGMIAGVFVNRLKIGMRLQTDPTVIYGMGDTYQGSIRKVDLQTDTPYNTYTRSGLPPTPISLPGQAALKATFQPDQTNALYFVSRGDGSSHFSSTLAEHNSAVNQYIRSK